MLHIYSLGRVAVVSAILSGPLLERPAEGQSKDAAIRTWALDDKSVDVRAENWVGQLTLRFPEDRDWVVLFFDWPLRKSAQGVEDYHKLAGYVRELNAMVSKNREVLVFALTPAREEALASFREKLEPRFPIGTRSLSYKNFKISNVPTALLLSRAKGVAGEYDDPAALTRWWKDVLSAKPPPSQEDAVSPFEVRDWSFFEELDRPDLEKYVRDCAFNPSNGKNTRRALEMLRMRMAPGDFMALCDELSDFVPGRTVYNVGAILYERHLADPAVEEKQPDEAPSSEVDRQWRADPDDARWDLYRAAAAEFRAHPMWGEEDVVAFYKRHLTDMENDVMTRSWVAGELRNRNDPDLLPALMRMIDLEPDPRIRAINVLLMGALSPPGQPDVLRFVQEKLKTEANILFARAALLTVEHALLEESGGRP